jgi:hypothetical protein
MTDVSVPPLHWSKLKGSANCFIPKLLTYSASRTAPFSKADLARAAQSRGLKSFSAHVVGRAMDLLPLTHEKCRSFLDAYVGLDAAIQAANGPLTDIDIVAAFFVVHDLDGQMKTAGMTAADLSLASGVSVRAINYASKNGRVKSGRVSGAIAAALHSALAAVNSATPPLAYFATSNPDVALAEKTIVDSPFSHDDLLIPLPADVPNPWY